MIIHRKLLHINRDVRHRASQMGLEAGRFVAQKIGGWLTANNWGFV